MDFRKLATKRGRWAAHQLKVAKHIASLSTAISEDEAIRFANTLMARAITFGRTYAAPDRLLGLFPEVSSALRALTVGKSPQITAESRRRQEPT